MATIDQYSAQIGLDWADKKHDVCIQFKSGERVFNVIEHTPEALDTWLKALHKQVKGNIHIEDDQGFHFRLVVRNKGRILCPDAGAGLSSTIRQYGLLKQP